jgi:methionyl-tRNA formyltransferase
VTPPERKRLVILTRAALEHYYVANALCKAFSIDAILVAQAHRAPRRPSRYEPSRIFWALAHRMYWQLVRDARRRRGAFVRILGAEETSGFHRADLVRPVEEVNSTDCARLLAGLQPDIVLVYGTAIVADPILRLADDLTLNMHTGLSPYYRGADTWLWPLVNGELGRVGATVHECTSTVDGGPIFATRQARLGPTRELYDLFAWSVAAGAEIYVEVVRRYLEGDARGVPQDLSLGREYRSAERTLTVDRLARRMIRAGAVDDFVEVVTSATERPSSG